MCTTLKPCCNFPTLPWIASAKVAVLPERKVEQGLLLDFRFDSMMHLADCIRSIVWLRNGLGSSKALKRTFAKTGVAYLVQSRVVQRYFVVRVPYKQFTLTHLLSSTGSPFCFVGVESCVRSCFLCWKTNPKWNQHQNNIFSLCCWDCWTSLFSNSQANPLKRKND